MKNFKTYYKQDFQRDLQNFVGQIPVEGNKHYDRNEFNIQYFFLTPQYKGCDIIITTANSAAPRKKEDTFKAVDIQGYRDLIDTAGKNNVRQFIYTSAFIQAPEKYARWIPLGGPEALSAMQVKEGFEKVQNKKLKVKRTPAFMIKVLGNAFSLFNTPASNIFKLSYEDAVKSSVVDCRELAQKLSIELTSAEEYLQLKTKT